MNRLIMGLGWLAGLVVSNALAAPPSTIDIGALNEPGSRGELFAEGCNRALSMHISEWAVLDEHAGQPAPPGQRWLALELKVENRMPADLIFDLGYQEAILIASLKRQGYLVINGEQVSRRVLFASDEQAIDDGFVLGRMGEERVGRVVYPIPATKVDTLSFHYYHDDYAALDVTLLGAVSTDADPTLEMDMDVQSNDLMEIGVVSVDFLDTLHNQVPPEGMNWLSVDLRGRSLWENPADALALDRDAAIGIKVGLPHVMEYVEAEGLLQVVVDGVHGYVRNHELSSLMVEPAWLPEVMAGGVAVFPVPEDANAIELVTYFPEFRATGISSDIRPPLRFSLLDGDISGEPGPPLAVVEDKPTPLTIHALHPLREFAGHQAGGGEILLRVEASMTNLSGTGGMMSVSQRLRPLEPAGELLGVYQQGDVELVEPFWLPANDEPRHFGLLYRYTVEAETFEFEYGGVSVNTSLTLSP